MEAITDGNVFLRVALSLVPAIYCIKAAKDPQLRVSSAHISFLTFELISDEHLFS